MWKCPPSTILVPVDFGDASARAVSVGAALAASLGARLVVLHAESLDTPPYFTHEQMGVIQRERRAAKSRAEEYVTDFARKAGASVPEVRIVEGSATDVIAEAAREADLVVMGTHGRKGASRWWLGSVAERVVHQSGTPVLVVRAGRDADDPTRVFVHPIVVAPGGQDDAATRVAAGLSSAFGGQVADRVATCQDDLAGSRDATMVVVSRGQEGHGLLFGHPAEHWLRSCALPMLFVPSTVAVPS
jgi:nucleotide-binding universal stress UspA family protein